MADPRGRGGAGGPAPRIRARPRAGPAAALALCAAFAIVSAAVITAEGWAFRGAEISAGEPAPHTVRAAALAGVGAPAGPGVDAGPILAQRGAALSEDTAAAARAALESRPRGLAGWAGYAGLALVLALGYVLAARTRRGGLARAHVVTLGAVVALAAAAQAALLLTTVSNLLMPVAGLALLGAVAVDRRTGVAAGALAAALIALLGPADLGVAAVLGAQALAPVAACREGEKRRLALVLAGLVGGAAAAAVYAGLHHLSAGALPVAELADPLRSPWLASGAGGALGGLLAAALAPVYRYLLGEVTAAKLTQLADLSHPLLKELAAVAPGTWQHSLATANMAEVAASAVGADGALARVGAYYHDVGKSVQPEYYVENLAPGVASPHDHLPPQGSRDAIVAHVTDGLRLARRYRVPARIADFIATHHGDGVLEYFWSRCRAQGNPRGLTEADFRYPGVRPHSRETAIVAICDAVEAASRTLKSPSERSIEDLVRRIVHGKLAQGQLDESGLTLADLRGISAALVAILASAHHGRVEYPWQSEEERDDLRDGAALTPTTADERPGQAVDGADEGAALAGRAAPRAAMTDTGDAARPDSGDAELGIAPTERLSQRPAPDAAGAPGAAGAGAPGGATGAGAPGGAADKALALGETAPQAATQATSKAGTAAPEAGEADGSSAAVASGREGAAAGIEPGAAADGAAPGEGGPESAAAGGDSSREGGPEAAEAEEEDDALGPGTMVLGPPPKSRGARARGRDASRGRGPREG